MLFYLSIFLTSTFLVNIAVRSDRRQRKIIIGFALLLPALVATFRGFEVGADTQNYYDRYQAFVNADGFKAMMAVLDTELFFIIACYVSKFIGGYHLVFFSYSFLTLLFVYLALFKYKKYLCVWLGYVLFLFFFYQASLNIMRQILAVPYILYCTTFLLDGKKKKFLILASMSVLFHLTAIVASAVIYVIYVVANKSRHNKNMFFLFYVCALTGFFLVDLLMRYLASINFGNSYAYTSDEGNSLVSSTDILYSCMIIGLSYYSMKKKWVSRISPEFFYLASVACLVFFMTGYYNQWLSRMAYYMLVFVCLYFPMIAHSPKLRRKRQVYKLAFFSIGLLYWLYLFVICGSTATIPYKTMGGIAFDF